MVNLYKIAGTMDNNQIIQGVLSEVLGFFNMDFDIKVDTDDDLNLLIFNIDASDPSLLIGKDGDNLKALQTLIKMMVYKKINDSSQAPFSIDVNDYRKKRLNFLKDLAKNFANEVDATRRSVTLQPMTSFERRIIHMEVIAQGKSLATESIGEGSFRCVVIKPL